MRNLIYRSASGSNCILAIISFNEYRYYSTTTRADELNKKIIELQAILQSEKRLLQVIKTDLKRVKKTYSDDRRAIIEDQIEEIKIDVEVMIPQEDVIVTVTKEGYVKRTGWRSHNALKRQRLRYERG